MWEVKIWVTELSIVSFNFSTKPLNQDSKLTTGIAILKPAAVVNKASHIPPESMAGSTF